MEKRNENENRNQNPNRNRVAEQKKGWSRQRKAEKDGERASGGASETETDFTPGEYQFQICQAAAGQSARSGGSRQQAAGSISCPLGATLERTA